MILKLTDIIEELNKLEQNNIYSYRLAIDKMIDNNKIDNANTSLRANTAN